MKLNNNNNIALILIFRFMFKLCKFLTHKKLKKNKRYFKFDLVAIKKRKKVVKNKIIIKVNYIVFFFEN